MESLLPWVLFSVSWVGTEPPHAHAESIFYSRERCLKAGSRYHEFWATGALESKGGTYSAFKTKFVATHAEMRCKQVDVDSLLAPYASDSDTRPKDGDAQQGPTRE